MFCLITYDIQEDRKRNRVAKILKDYGERVQKSVFECNINEKMLERMIKIIEKSINLENDGFRVYEMQECQKANVLIIGKGKVIDDDKDFQII